MNWYFKLVDGTGRATRKKFWYFVLFSIISTEGIRIISALIGGFTFPESLGVLIIYFLAIVIPSLAIQSRRLHDTNRSGWWILIYTMPLIIYILWLQNISQWFFILPGTGLIVLTVFLLQDSTPGDNQYGPNPKTSDSQALKEWKKTHISDDDVAEELEVAEEFCDRAALYGIKGKFAKAESLYLKVLAMRENVLGTNHLLVIETLKSLEDLYRQQGKISDAEALEARFKIILPSVITTNE